MANGFISLSPESIKTHEGIAELNRMLQFLFDVVAGDGEQRKVFNGVGSPEGTIVAGIGSIYMRTDGSASTSLYVKESGTGATGWVAK